jgi:hypothetical protein
MFPAIVHRGPHAFGWMYHGQDIGIEYDKYTGDVTKHHNLDKVQIPSNVDWFVCHVRYATKGDPANNANNHPLLSGNIIGVHNGTLSGDWQKIIDDVGRFDESAEVDSEAIFAAVNKYGVVEGVKKINGNMVAVIAETGHPEVLNIARSYGRPLVYATTAAGSLIFASECCVIDACGLDDMKIVGQDVKGTPTPYTDVKGQYRLLKVVKGEIVSREQYRTPPPKKEIRPVPTRIPFERGGTSGITDYFDRQRTLDRAGFPSASRTSLNAPAAGKAGTRKGSVDKWGGEYLGAGWYRVLEGKIMPVSEYIEWRVQREVEARLDAMDAAEMAAEAEAQAQAVIEGNG